MALSDYKLSAVLEDAKAAVFEGRAVLLKYFKNLAQIREKNMAGLVSEADIESERVITTHLKSCFAEIPVLGEESSFESGRIQFPGSTFWVLDPLDGTTNYVHGFHVFCISLGLVIDNELALAVVDVPLLKTTYWAIKGSGAYKNGQRLQVSETREIKNSLLATGFFADDKVVLREQLQIFSHFVSQARGIRRAGAAAYDLCLVAEGVFDAFWEKNLKPWDTSAGTLLVREAGGHVVNYQGQDFELAHTSILASNARLHQPLLDQLQNLL
jgi:myo-inositol-1(or 4)-monophosphatase